MDVTELIVSLVYNDKGKVIGEKYHGELIRCRECKYWLPHSQFGFDEDNDEYYDYCELLVPDDDYYAVTRKAEDFCSRAKRKEHETD